MKVNDLLESELHEALGNLDQLGVGALINVLKQGGGGDDPLTNKFQQGWNDTLGPTSEIIDLGRFPPGKGMAMLRKGFKEHPEGRAFAIYIGGKAVIFAASDADTLAGASRYSKIAYDFTAFNDVLKQLHDKSIADHNATANAWNKKDPNSSVKLPNAAAGLTTARSKEQTRYNYSTREQEPAPTQHFQGRGISTGEFKTLYADVELIAQALNQPITCKLALKDVEGQNKRRSRMSSRDMNSGAADLRTRLQKFKLSKKPTAKSIEEFIAMSLNGVSIAQFGGRSYKMSATTYDNVDPIKLLQGGGFRTLYTSVDPGSYDKVEILYRYDPANGMLKPYYATWSEKDGTYSGNKQDAVLDPKQYVQAELGQITDKTTVVTNLLKQFKAGSYKKVLLLVNSMEAMGIDWPEFGAIKKSIAVELNKPKA